MEHIKEAATADARRLTDEVRQQALSDEERALMARGYALFEHFREQLREEHEEMRMARMMRQLRQDDSGTAPLMNTLNSCMDNVIADQIDELPEALMVPEREATAHSAEEMSDVVSYVLYQAGWPGKYQALMEDAIVAGTGVAEVFWDEDAEDGEGMVSVMCWHPEDFYPDPSVENIQDGRAVFKVTHTTVAWIEEHYPQARGCVRAENSEEAIADAPDGDAQVMLIEFWYKRYDAEIRRTRVHMAQFAGHALLYSTQTGYGVEEGKEAYAEGVYAHGEYPFTLFKYRDVWRRPFGTGMAHDYRETQNAIDRYCKYIDDNARFSSVQRHFIRRNSGVNPEDVADMRKTIIEWEGSDIREVMQTVQAAPLNGQVYQIMQYMIDGMKQDCGQNQFSRGEAGLGVTAASAIEKLQTAGGKITRMHTEKFKEAFRRMIEQILWVLSEYMEPGRKLRIVGGWDSAGGMRERLVELIAPSAEGDALPRPGYTVRVQVQRNNPAQIQADNEFLMEVAALCEKAGRPMAPEVIVRLMEGHRTKESVLRAMSAEA